MTISRKLYDILTPAERGAVALLLMLMLIGMALETLGVGLVIPALMFMTQTDLAARYPALEPALIAMGNPSHERLIVAVVIVLVAVYAVKAFYLAFLAWRQSRFAFGLQANLSQQLFTCYLHQPFAFHLQRNSAQLIRNTTGEVGVFMNAAQSAMILMTEFFVMFGIGTLLLLVEPLGATLVAFTLGIAGWAFYRLTRVRILQWGKARRYHEGLRIKHLQHGLGGVKDVKMFGREDDFLSQYKYHSMRSLRVGQRHYALQQLPRLWLELLAVVGLAGLVLAMIVQGKPLAALLPTLGLFAVAAFRLMPSVVRILNAIQAIRYALPAVNALHEELRILTAPCVPKRDRPMLFRQVLTLENVSFRYPSGETPALDDISLSIPRGAFVGFIGGSGAGKSTLVDVILGLLSSDSGAVKVDNVDIQTNLRGWQDQIGYVPQTIFLTDDTLRRNVAFGLPNEQIDEAAVWRAIRAAQLDEFVKSSPAGLDTIVGERGVRLSGGQRQRIGIARALYHDPPVLVLDEATSSLDTTTERGVINAVQVFHGHKTVLIVSHRFSTVDNCDRLFRLERGRVVEEGKVSQVLG